MALTVAYRAVAAVRSEGQGFFEIAGRAGPLPLLLCACNQVFGIQPTHLALPDAPPPVCPALGTAPTFTGESVAVFTGGCTMYTPSEMHDLALAECGYVLQGPADKMLGPAMVPTGATNPRLAPEGNIALFTMVDTISFQPTEHDVLAYDGTAWMKAETFPAAPVALPVTSVPTRWTAGAHVVMSGGSDGDFHEYVRTGPGTWTSTTIAPSALGFTIPGVSIEQPNLTPDGLRLVFIASYPDVAPHIYYADRDQIDGAFRPAVPLELPQVPAKFMSPYMTEDCGQLYFTDTSTAFFIRQL